MKYTEKPKPYTETKSSNNLFWITIAVLTIVFGFFTFLPHNTPNTSQELPPQTEFGIKISDTPKNIPVVIAKNVSNSVTNDSPLPEKSDIMAGIRITSADNSAYDRKSYYSSWSKISGKCNIRSELLSSASLVDTVKNTNCTVIYGSWQDPYSGVILTGNPYQGDGIENDMEIDHIIPLHYVNQHGGASWSSDKKHEYGSSITGMNSGLYIAVSKTENQKKSDKGPSEYYPENPDYRCEYSQKWHDIALAYDISLEQSDYDIIKSTLETCQNI